MSNIAQVAKHLQKYGRNGDSVLVHMQPREIRALEQAAGHPLTVNPTTGLPEAFSLWKLLAGLGAAAAAPFTGGTSLAFLAPVLGATGAALAASSLGSGKKSQSANEDPSAARQYINAQAQKAKENYKIPWMEIGKTPAPQPGVLAGVSPEQNLMPIRKPVGWISPGGQVSAPPGYAEGGMIPEQMEAEAVKQALLSGNYDEETLNRFVEIYGIEALQQMLGQQQPQQAAQGGLLRGPGGGMDDLIPASVQGKVPVALSGGEYIWPADAVAALGDGNNEAGGRVLDAAVQRTRQMKTGKTQQPGKINVRKALPV